MSRASAVDQGLASVPERCAVDGSTFISKIVAWCTRRSTAETGGIGKTLPQSPRLVGRNEDRTALVAGADQLEQHAGLGLVLRDVGEVVENEEVEPVEPVDRGLEDQFATRDLELLHQIGRSREETFRRSRPERARALPPSGSFPAGWAEQEQVGALGEPAVASVVP